MSDLKITFDKSADINGAPLLLYLSKAPLVNANGQVDFEHLQTQVVRTISIQSNEASYTATYLHPDTYYITVFSDADGNFYPSSGEVTSLSQRVEVQPEQLETSMITIDLRIP
ncbi:MAG: hypothetical protein AAF738_02675 [Bacteroidota bacterium]